MTPIHPELTQAQKNWVVRVTHVLGSATPGTSSSNDSGLHLNEVKVSLVAEKEAATEKTRHERRHALIIPREHGAWGLLLVPMITGAGVALRESNNFFPFVLLLTTALAMFWLRTPLGSFLGISPMRAESRGECRSVAFALFYLGTVVALSLGMLLWNGRNPLLWPLGGVAFFCFAIQMLLKQPRLLSRAQQLVWRRPPRKSALAVGGCRTGQAERPRGKHSTFNLRMLSEVIGTIGLTASAPAAYYVITGKLNATALILWFANLIFAGNQIHYVQLRIHSARIHGLGAKLSHSWTFAAGQAVMTAVLTVACLSGALPKFASIAFAPVLFRGWFYFIRKPAPLAVRKLGWSELGQAIAFCALFIATFSL